MNQRILEELKNSSNTKLNELNVEFSSVMQNDFNEILESSVNRMERENRISQNDLEIAKRNINRYIENLAQYREKQFGAKDIIRYKSLNESRSSLCPLWPIC